MTKAVKDSAELWPIPLSCTGPYLCEVLTVCVLYLSRYPYRRDAFRWQYLLAFMCR
jgi:hypothetical protein